MKFYTLFTSVFAAHLALLFSTVLAQTGTNGQPVAPAKPVRAQESQAQTTQQTTQQTALKPLNRFVGQWRGVGQLRRGSSKGAWSEKTSCQWKFQDDKRSVIFKSEGGQQFSRLEIGFDEASQKITLKQTLDDITRTYSAPVPKSWSDPVKFTTVPNDDGTTYRFTLHALSDIRSTFLLEKQATPTGSFRRIAGIGYTRSGAKLASSQTKNVCVVTGGTGTIPVSHKGKTYYVCCSGCQQAFEDDPDGIIAAWEASQQESK